MYRHYYVNSVFVILLLLPMNGRRKSISLALKKVNTIVKGNPMISSYFSMIILASVGDKALCRRNRTCSTFY